MLKSAKPIISGITSRVLAHRSFQFCAMILVNWRGPDAASGWQEYNNNIT